MCRSFTTSVLTGLLSYSIAYLLWIRNSTSDRSIALITVVFSTIQWLEAIIWYTFTINDKRVAILINRIASLMIPIVLSMELMTSYYVSNYYGESYIKWLYIIVSLLLVIMWYLTIGINHTTIDNVTGSLLWGGNTNGITFSNRLLFLFFLIFPLIPQINIPAFSIMIIGVTLTFIYSLMYNETFGSNWCWISNILPVCQLII